jgi:hypothetical protein
MKKKKEKYISGLLILFMTVISCSDDFLLKNEVNLYTVSDTLFLTSDQQNVETTVQLPTDISSDFTIFMQPKWLSFDSMHGTISNGVVPLSFSVVKENIPTWYPSIYQTYYATLMLDVENLGLISLTVGYAYLGNPTLHSSSTSLSYDASRSTTFTISNTSDGILNWKIAGAPDWLKFSVTSGTLNYQGSATITAWIDPASVPQGQDLSETFLIESNSISGDLTIQVHVTKEATVPPKVSLIPGIVTDAEYNHETGIMAICTKSPNSLIIFNTTTDVSNTISLDKIPVCISLSEDGHKAVIGYSTEAVSYIDIDNHIISQDYTIDCVPFDIVLGDNGWCYITPSFDQWVNFRNLNLNSGELVVIPSTGWSTMYENTIIKKVSGKPYLVGSRPSLSPTGIIIYDITNGIANETTTYYHTSLGKFLISEDATRIYGSYKNIYVLPPYDAEYHPFDPALVGQINSEFNTICAIDECPFINSIFTAFSSYNYSNGITETSPYIYQFNTTNLSKIGEFNASPVFVTENEIKSVYETGARYIFVNKEGSLLFAVKNLKESYNKEYWTIETFGL